MTTLSDRRELWLDIETYSSVDIRTAGLYPYVESDDFEVMLIAYAWGDEPVQLLDLASSTGMTPADAADLHSVLDALTSPSVVKIAHNAAFERTALGKHRGAYLPPEQWDDTMVRAAFNGLPLSLEAAGDALGIERQKLKSGAALISYFCKPCKPTVANGGRTRNRPDHAPEKWGEFCRYCVRDVDAMRQIYRRLDGPQITPEERRVWLLDTRVAERGVLIDRELAEAAVAVDAAFTEEHTEEMRRLTGLDNPNSVVRLKAWLGYAGMPVDSLDKETVKDLYKQATDGTAKRVLELRQLLGKTSTTKYTAMLTASCADDRVRGVMQYYGATRTGRWAGRVIQPQNLPQNHLQDLDAARALVRARDLGSLELIYDSVPDVLSQLIRTAIIAPEGHTLLVADYSAIEVRVIAYLAGERWRMDVFAQGGDIYCSSASQMFKVPVEKHGANAHLRQKGKIAELACGYGGGVGALRAFGADKMGLSEPEMADIVAQWRAASPTIPRFWRDTERAAKDALRRPGTTQRIPCGVLYKRDADALRCKLPSGRVLTYWGARLDTDGSVCFMGQNQTTKKWEKVSTWGGKLVENIVQAYARDCLAVAMLRLDAAGYKIVFHVHDEIIAEAPEGSRWEDMAAIMGKPIDWAPGLLLRAEGYSTRFYRKD